jgi:hypothetical protein
LDSFGGSPISVSGPSPSPKGGLKSFSKVWGSQGTVRKVLDEAKMLDHERRRQTIAAYGECVCCECVFSVCVLCGECVGVCLRIY